MCLAWSGLVSGRKTNAKGIFVTLKTNARNRSCDVVLGGGQAEWTLSAFFTQQCHQKQNRQYIQYVAITVRYLLMNQTFQNYRNGINFFKFWRKSW
jgi:hypothetical protein